MHTPSYTTTTQNVQESIKKTDQKLQKCMLFSLSMLFSKTRCLYFFLQNNILYDCVCNCLYDSDLYLSLCLILVDIV